MYLSECTAVVFNIPLLEQPQRRQVATCLRKSPRRCPSHTGCHRLSSGQKEDLNDERLRVLEAAKHVGRLREVDRLDCAFERAEARHAAYNAQVVIMRRVLKGKCSSLGIDSALRPLGLSSWIQ
jgi:hypothetical protein